MQSVSACPMNEADGHTQPGKPGRMIVVARLDKSCRIGNIHTSFVVVCPFHAPVMSFPFWLFLFYGFSPVWGIERSGFFNGREKWAKGFENQRV